MKSLHLRNYDDVKGQIRMDTDRGGSHSAFIAFISVTISSHWQTRQTGQILCLWVIETELQEIGGTVPVHKLSTITHCGFVTAFRTPLARLGTSGL